MAGLSDALDRIVTIVEACDEWTRSEKRVYGFDADPDTGADGIEHTFWINATPRNAVGLVTPKAHHQRRYGIIIELARFYGEGDLLGREWFSLMKSIEAEANIVEQSLDQAPNNWNFASSGIILINLDESELLEPSHDNIMVWRITLDVLVRQPDVSVAVA